MTRNVAVIVGSLRKESFTRKVARALAELGKPQLELEEVEIGNLPLYNQDLDTAPPAEWTAFRDRVSASSAVLFATPEYNRSVPGVLKNAVDVGSRRSRSRSRSSRSATCRCTTRTTKRIRRRPLARSRSASGARTPCCS